MALMISCTNKSCRSIGPHKLNLETNEVVCSDCGKPIEVRDITKHALKSQVPPQVVKNNFSEDSSRCPECGYVGDPLIKRYSKFDEVVVCGNCHTVNRHLTSYFLQLLKMKKNIQVVEATPEEKSERGVLDPFKKVKTTKVEEKVVSSEPVSDSPKEAPVEPEVEPVEYFQGERSKNVKHVFTSKEEALREKIKKMDDSIRPAENVGPKPDDF